MHIVSVHINNDEKIKRKSQMKLNEGGEEEKIASEMNELRFIMFM